MQLRADSAPSRLSRSLLNLASLSYKAVSFIHLNLKALRQKSFPGLFLISVDSLSFGGTGKTPLVMAIATALERRGARVAVISRGYRSRFEKGGARVEAAHSCADVGDEARMLKARLPGQDVFIGRDRLRSIAAAAARNNRILILDDGFQSNHIRKDFSIMLVHPGHPYFYLRHFRFLSRRDSCVLTYRPVLPAGEAQAEGTYGFTLTKFLDAGGQEVDAGGAVLIAFSGLGDNGRFTDDMGRFRLAAFRPFADHYAFGPADIRSLEALRKEKGAAWMVCTEKDFFRIKDILPPGIPLLYTQNEIQLPGDLMERIIAHAREKSFI